MKWLLMAETTLSQPKARFEAMFEAGLLDRSETGSYNHARS
jgi:hypothetical protein